jgi:hypothetical protein
MSLENNHRAVLTIAALTKLAVMRRRVAQDDASGLVTVEFLERLVINGSVAERDKVLKWFEQDESFERALASRQPLATA